MLDRFRRGSETNIDGEVQRVTDAQAQGVGHDVIDLVTKVTNGEQFVKGSEPLGVEHMQDLADAFPMWSVTSAITHGKTRKTFSRDLSDLKPELKEDSTIIRRFSDGEDFDIGLREIFAMQQGEGNVGSQSYFSISAEGSGPITFGDAMRVATAESYLMQTGLLNPPEPTVAAAA